MDRGRTGVQRAGQRGCERPHLLEIEAEFLRERGQASFVDIGQGAVGAHAEGAEALIVNDDGCDVFAAGFLRAVGNIADAVAVLDLGDDALAAEKFGSSAAAG